MRSFGVVLLGGSLLLSGSLLLGCNMDLLKEIGLGDKGSDADPESGSGAGVEQMVADQENLATRMEAMQKREPADPVSYESLLSLLPAPEGWTAAGEPRGETSEVEVPDVGTVKHSTVEQSYFSGEGKDVQHISVIQPIRL